MEERVEKAIGVAYRYAGIDGAHHKQWVIDQMLRELLGESYTQWVVEFDTKTNENGNSYDPWDVGVAP